MRVIGLVILLVGLVLVASVTGAMYGAPLLAAGTAVLFLERYLKKREYTKPGAPRFVPVQPPGKRPAAKRAGTKTRAAAKAPVAPKTASPKTAAAAKAPVARAKSEPKVEPVLTRDQEPAMASGFVPIFEGEESSTVFADLRNEISPAAKDALAVLRDAGFVIRARTDRVSVSRDNHTEVLRSNAAIVDYLKQLGLSGE